MHNLNSIAIGIRNVNTKSGLGKILLEQVTFYLAQGIDVVIYTSKHDNMIASTGVKIVKIPRIPFIGEYYQRLLFAKQAERKIAKAGHDLVIGHGDLIHQDVMFLHNLVEKAYLLTYNQAMVPLNPIAKIRRLILQKQQFKLLIANSNLMKNELLTAFNIPEEKVEIVYPGFDPKQFNVNNHKAIREDTRLQLETSNDILIIGFITSGDFKKRALTLFIEALHQLSTDLEYKVLLVGKDKNLPKYMSLAKKYGLDDKFIIKDPIDTIEKYFHAVDFTVHPAYFEEFGMVVQEAMACGIPVITSQCVGASEIMNNTSTIITKPNITDITIQIEKLLRNSKLRQELKASALKSVTQTDWQHYLLNSNLYINTATTKKKI